jgi:hypothetical protein
MEESAAHLDFLFVEDLARAAARGRLDIGSRLKSRSIERIGPLLELLGFHRVGLLQLGALPPDAERRALDDALSPSYAGRGAFGMRRGAQFGFITTSRNTDSDAAPEEHVFWNAFCQRAQRAAELSLPKAVAQGLIGALREIEDNVHVHSDRAQDGVVGFRGTASDFEFSVGDSGVGILQSLKTSPDYAHLTDSGEAIQIALSEGHSRLRYIDPNRGSGFRDLFIGLANLNGELRFRSGDHAFVIDGSSPSLMRGERRQQHDLQGFVASVICRLKPISTRP